jgi:hypothetical protein
VIARNGRDAGVPIIGPECAIRLQTPVENLRAIRRAAAQRTGAGLFAILSSMRYYQNISVVALLLSLVVAPWCCLYGQDSQALKSIHKVYIEKMPNDLDQYLRAEIAKQFKGKLVVVLKKEEADGIITGVNEEQKGTASKITGRYLGLHDTVNGTISLLDKTESALLWSDEAGDRNLFFGIAHRGGARKVAERLIGKLKKAMEAAR